MPLHIVTYSLTSPRSDKHFNQQRSDEPLYLTDGSSIPGRAKLIFSDLRGIDLKTGELF